MKVKKREVTRGGKGIWKERRRNQESKKRRNKTKGEDRGGVGNRKEDDRI